MYFFCFAQDVETAPIECEGGDTWQHGNSLVNYMKLVEMTGLTGRIAFDSRGFRLETTNLHTVEFPLDQSPYRFWHQFAPSSQKLQPKLHRLNTLRLG